MDVARSLQGRRPQANLVPQPHDAVAPVAAWLPRRRRRAAGPRGAGEPAGARGRSDLRGLLLSPVGDALLGPPAVAAALPAALDLAWVPPAAVEVRLGHDPEDGATPSPADSPPAAPAPAPRPGRSPAAALALAIAAASSALAAEVYHGRQAALVAGSENPPDSLDTRRRRG
jgi:hypothetical protein